MNLQMTVQPGATTTNHPKQLFNLTRSTLEANEPQHGNNLSGVLPAAMNGSDLCNGEEKFYVS